MKENTQSSPLDKITQLIANGDLEDAIKQLSELLKHTKHLDEILVQSARYNDLKKQIRMDEVNFENADLTKNKITFALIELMNEIEEELTSNPVVKEEIKAYEKQLSQKINIKDAGVVALKGIVNIQGEYVAGRDMVIGEKPKKKSFLERLFGK